MTFASGLVLGAFLGCLYWAFITGRVGLVGEEDYYGRIEEDAS